MSKKKKQILELYLLKKQQDHYRYVYSIIKHRDDALDVVQESILKALKSYHQLKDTTKINAWFYRILMTTSYDYLRKNKKYNTQLSEVSKLHLSSYFDQYADIDLADAISTLSVNEQTALYFRYYEDMKNEDIAKLLGENINTVKTRIYGALKKLYPLLEPNIKEEK
ncbi:RNA polymerase sigma factor [Clostridia bacterium]|nr:RNA polymerase sigma factor [Clostridia bacterium]